MRNSGEMQRALTHLERHRFAQTGAAFVLGTAQLGRSYGAANTLGMPDEAAAGALIDAALEGGVTILDTARAYGAAEERLGRALQRRPAGASVTVVTKLDPLDGLSPVTPAAEAVRAAQASLDASRRALRRDRLDTVLLHRAEIGDLWKGAVWRLLREDRTAGRIGRIGVSTTTPAETLRALADPDVDALQFPTNPLDHRWRDAGLRKALSRRGDVTVHVRSVLLQGLLAGSPGTRWPSVPEPWTPVRLTALFAGLAAELGRAGPVDLCLAFVRALPRIDGIVVGTESVAQLRANLGYFSRPPLTADELALVIDRMPEFPETFLDPSRWRS
jgi:aryl-alcohol dehydrogenase-like predicted oxidoreductase